MALWSMIIGLDSNFEMVALLIDPEVMVARSKPMHLKA